MARDTSRTQKKEELLYFRHGYGIAVEPNQSNDIRISVSFNFIQQGFE